jgi:hypothetical protein
VSTHPAAAFPLGTVLRDPESGRLAVRFQQDDTTGKGMHAWYMPAPDPADARILHHVEVIGWEPVGLPPGVVEAVRAVLERQAVELAKVRASREAWAIEADRLDVIATAAEYHTGPEECCDSECGHLHDDEGNFIGTDGEWCPHVEMRHATAQDAIEAHKVPLLEARIETLDREAAADAEAYQDLLGAIWLHVGWRSVTRQLTTEQRELWAAAVETFSDPDVKVTVDRWWCEAAPVSGSDTTEDEETCGDCADGRCHWGSDGPFAGEECGCALHDASVLMRQREGRDTA